MILQQDDILSANDYIPLMEKAQIASHIAERCVSYAEITTDDGKANLPRIYRENKELTSRYMMGVLAVKYLGKKIDPVGDEEYLMSADDYDRWAGSHVLNQIKRFKADKSLVNKCFDILDDYNDLYRRALAELHANIQVQNDMIVRGIEAMRSTMTPEAMQNMTKETEELMTLLEKYKK